MSTSTLLRYIISLVLVIIIVTSAWLLMRGEIRLPLPPELQSNVMVQPLVLQPFALSDQEGEAFTLNNLMGHWSFLFFGYTRCPDICPTTLATLQGMANKLGTGTAHDSRFIFVSVDPQRDNPEHLNEYLRYFNPAFIGITGERREIDNLARQVGVVYFFEGDTSGVDYIVNHTATVLLIDPQGRLYARFNPPHNVQAMLDTFQRVRDYYAQ